MDEDANTLLIKTCYEKFSTGDISGLIENLSEDIVLIMPEVENSPLGGIWHGRADVARLLELTEEVQEMTDFEVREYLAQGDRVVVLGRSTSTVRATGRHYSTEWVHLLTVRDGKITSFTQYFDTAAALRAYQMVTTALK